MKIKLVASDLDGTIIDKNNNISEKNFKANNLLNEKNVKFAICTGKSYAVSKMVCQKFNANYGIFGNGTQIVNLITGEELYRKVLSKKDLLFISTLAKRYGFHIHLYTENDIITEKLEYMDLRNYILKSQNSNSSLNFVIIPNIIDYIESNNLEIFSIVVSTEKTTLKSFKNILSINNDIVCTYINKRGQYKDLIINKSYEYLNISPNNINKNEALKYLSNFLNIKSQEIMAIGDNINDLEMVKNSGIGVAVLEAYDDLKNVAKFVTTTSVSNGAFAEAVEKFV